MNTIEYKVGKKYKCVNPKVEYIEIMEIIGRLGIGKAVYANGEVQVNHTWSAQGKLEPFIKDKNKYNLDLLLVPVEFEETSK